MAQPKTVKKQAKKAAKLQKEHIEKLEGKDPETPDKDEKQADLSLVVDPPLDPPAPAAQDNNWEERFKGLKSTHDKTVSDLRLQNSNSAAKLEEATNQITSLTAKVEELNNAVNEPSAAQPTKIEVSESEREEYGQGLIDLIEKVSGSNNQGAVVDLAKQLLDIEKRLDAVVKDTKQVGETHVRDKRAEFFAELDKKVPNWRTINGNDKFHGWLADEMPGTGQERQFYLTQHFDNHDATRTASLFNEFLAANGAPVSPQDALEEQIQPSNTNAATVDSRANTAEKVWGRTEIKTFYRDKREGKYSNRPEEARRIEKDILAATAQGRVKD